MKIAIDVPYYCQYNNQLHPDGSCNMTSAGMALKHYGIQVPGPYQYNPDNLLHYCDQNGLDRHDLGVIAQVIRHFGLADDASFTDKFDDLKSWVKAGNLVIVQGTFTQSGHVILWCGMDEEKGLIYCNDPAGDWNAPYHYSNPGWRPGKGVWYKSEWFRSHAAPDGLVWGHELKLIKLKAA